MVVIHPDVAKWVMKPIGRVIPGMQGIGEWKDDQLIAGIAFETQNKNCMTGHQRITQPPSKQFWMTVADYIFNQCHCKKFSAVVDVSNEKAIDLNKHIGFVIEATLQNHSDNGDVHIMTLWKENCRMLNWGKK